MKTILFIEDEAALQKALARGLMNAGYRVVSALDGEIGLQLARKEMPDLILLDLMLPRKDGFAVLAELKKDPATAKIPVIILSNFEANEQVDRALALGATTFLVKMNYRLEDVLGKVGEVIGQ